MPTAPQQDADPPRGFYVTPGRAVAYLAAAALLGAAVPTVALLRTAAGTSGQPARQHDQVRVAAPATGGDARPADRSVDVVEYGRETPIIEDYRHNEFAADAKYKGKVIRGAVGVEEVEKDQRGAWYIGTYRLQRPGIVDFYPSVVRWYLADSEVPKLAALPAGRPVTIRGRCEGKVKDGVRRFFDYLNFHIRITGCVLEGS
jgi:hypothetical protein